MITGGNQISINTILPTDFEKAVRRFSDQEFTRREEVGEHPHIKNPHEAYGILAQCHQALMRATKEVKSAMDSALAVLPSGVQAFSEQVDQAYSGCLDVALAAINMAVNGQNIAYAMSFGKAEPTPLEVAAEAWPDELPLEEDPAMPPEDDVAV